MISKKRRMALGVATTAVGVLTVMGAAAWACTVVLGQTVIDKVAGPPNTTLNASAVGAWPLDNPYNVYFLNAAATADGLTCMYHNATKIGGPATQTAGIILPTPATIPSNAQQGPSQICFATSNHSAATAPAIFTVL